MKNPEESKTWMPIPRVSSKAPVQSGTMVPSSARNAGFPRFEGVLREELNEVYAEVVSSLFTATERFQHELLEQVQEAMDRADVHHASVISEAHLGDLKKLVGAFMKFIDELRALRGRTRHGILEMRELARALGHPGASIGGSVRIEKLASDLLETERMVGERLRQGEGVLQNILDRLSRHANQWRPER